MRQTGKSLVLFSGLGQYHIDTNKRIVYLSLTVNFLGNLHTEKTQNTLFGYSENFSCNGWFIFLLSIILFHEWEPLYENSLASLAIFCGKLSKCTVILPLKKRGIFQTALWTILSFENSPPFGLRPAPHKFL